jgi:choline kinase
MQVVILAAGTGSRMGEITSNNHKSLLPINDNDSFLSHLLHQLNEYQLSKVVVVTGYLSGLIEEVVEKFQMNIEVVFNEKYKQDTNIYSMKLALDNLTNEDPIVIFEADTYIDEIALKKIMMESEKDNSIWFTKGRFNEFQYGGVLKDDSEFNITDIRIVPKYENRLKDYKKLLGIQTIGSREIFSYKELINSYVKKTLAQYYLIPWIENLNNLPCLSFDLSGSIIESVNNEKEYKIFINKLKENQRTVKIDLISINLLLPIEDHIQERADMLFKDISNNDFWTKPIVVEKDNFLILDGHHRFNVAKRMKLKNIPVVFIKYSDVDLWSLRKEEFVDIKTVIFRANNNDIYPNKTVKHKFPFSVPNCKIKISKLK